MDTTDHCWPGRILAVDRVGSASFLDVCRCLAWPAVVTNLQFNLASNQKICYSLHLADIQMCPQWLPPVVSKC